MNEKKPFTVRLPLELWDDLKKYTFNNDISVNKLIVKLIREKIYNSGNKALKSKNKK